MDDAVRGWIMDVGGGWSVATGAQHMIEYLLSPEWVPLPLTPRHCPGVLVWRERIIPVVDIGLLFGARAHHADRGMNAAVLAYQGDAGRRPDYGAVLLDRMPREVHVTDDMACALPAEPETVARVACSCFRYGDRAVPILDLPCLFGTPPASPAMDAGSGDTAIADHGSRATSDG